MPPRLAEPLTLPGGLTLENRIAKAATSERIGTRGGVPTEGHLALYERWGRGGAGLLITGNVMVDSGARAETGNVVVEDDDHIEALAAWARAATASGARVLAQINHPGRQIPRTLSRHPVAPSAVPVRGMFGAFAPPRALTRAEIEAIIRAFARTARILERAGFDGVQIHGAHGYLISQFLSPLTNRRDDEWGGDAARRRRFLLEVVRAVQSATSPGFALSVKLNSADFQRGGFSEEEALATAAALDREGRDGRRPIDLLEISGGTYESAAMFEETVPARESSRRREAFFLSFAETLRTRTSMPLMLTGGFRTAAGMEEALASGAVDLTGLARPLAAEPDLPARMLADEADSARPVRLATGRKLFDTIVQGSWYQIQIGRLARGLDPDPGLSRLRAAAGYFAPRPALAPARASAGAASDRAGYSAASTTSSNQM